MRCRRTCRLTSARVMVLNVTGVAAELCKNIVLAGVGSVALVDGTPARDAAAGNFLVPADAAADATCGAAQRLSRACSLSSAR